MEFLPTTVSLVVLTRRGSTTYALFQTVDGDNEGEAIIAPALTGEMDPEEIKQLKVWIGDENTKLLRGEIGKSELEKGVRGIQNHAFFQRMKLICLTYLGTAIGNSAIAVIDNPHLLLSDASNPGSRKNHFVYFALIGNDDMNFFLDAIQGPGEIQLIFLRTENGHEWEPVDPPFNVWSPSDPKILECLIEAWKFFELNVPR